MGQIISNHSKFRLLGMKVFMRWIDEYIIGGI